MTNADDEIEKMSQTILLELETATSKDLSTAHYAKTMLRLSDLGHTKGVLLEIQNASSGKKSDIEKKAVIKALLYSTWLQRLYFIIRSAIMSLVATVITLLVVSFFGTINVYGAIVLSVFVFVISLVITRLFDAQTVWVTKSIVRHLANHKTLRDFVMNHF
jgi:hypothetical protein